MPEHTAAPRPPQVTYAASAVMLGSLAMVVSAYQRIATLHSLATRTSVEKMVAEQPSVLHLTVTDWLEMYKVFGMVSAGCSVAAAILGWQVLQRSRSARVALLVLVVPMTIAGLMTSPLFAILVASGVVTLWLSAANAWFDPREHATMHPMSEAPPPPPPHEPPPPPPHEPGRYGYPYAPPQPPAWPPAPYGRLPFDPDARPGAVTAAAIITFILAGTTAVVGLFMAIVGASAAQQVLDEFVKRRDTSGLSAHEHEFAVALVGVGAVLTVFGVAAVIAAIFVLRRSRGGRIVLAVLSGLTIALSLVGVTAVLSLVTLAGAVVTIVLLFRGSSNAWFARRPQQPPYPPNQPPNHPGPWTGA